MLAEEAPKLVTILCKEAFNTLQIDLARMVEEQRVSAMKQFADAFALCVK
jgi:hypothetical protein